MCPILPSLIVYAPLMHDALLPRDLPAGLAVFRPGLPSPRIFPEKRAVPDEEPGGTPRVRDWCPDMPYSPSEAEACLADFRAMDEDALKGTPVHAVASCRRQGTPMPGLAEEEAGALARFAHGGASAAAAPPTADDEKRRAHRLLLLAWLQEERVLEVEELLARYRNSAVSLVGHIRSGEEDEAAMALALDGRDDPFLGLPPEDVRASLPSWRFALEQMAAFLPNDAALFTADDRMLAEWGNIKDLWREVEHSCVLPSGWDAAIRRRLVMARAPLWRLLGLAGPRSDKPGLDAARFVFMYRK